jgi:hypothetical protein
LTHEKGGPSARFLLEFHTHSSAFVVKSIYGDFQKCKYRLRRPHGVEVWPPPEGRSEVNRPRVSRPCQEIGPPRLLLSLRSCFACCLAPVPCFARAMPSARFARQLACCSLRSPCLLLTPNCCACSAHRLASCSRFARRLACGCSLRSPLRLRLLASLAVSPTRPPNSPCPPRLPAVFSAGATEKSARVTDSVTDRIGTSFFLLIYLFRVTLRVSPGGQRLRLQTPSGRDNESNLLVCPRCDPGRAELKRLASPRILY